VWNRVTNQLVISWCFQLQGVPIVGIDSEWKPFFGTKKNELALIQIASLEQVHILDVCSLGLECPNLWNKLGIILFANENIIKLGKYLYLMN
jgi:ribonuclease D